MDGRSRQAVAARSQWSRTCVAAQVGRHVVVDGGRRCNNRVGRRLLERSRWCPSGGAVTTGGRERSRSSRSRGPVAVGTVRSRGRGTGGAVTTGGRERSRSSRSRGPVVAGTVRSRAGGRDRGARSRQGRAAAARWGVARGSQTLRIRAVAVVAGVRVAVGAVGGRAVRLADGRTSAVELGRLRV